MSQTGSSQGERAGRAPRLSIGAFIGILHLLISVLGAGILTAFALYFIYQGGVRAAEREMRGITAAAAGALRAPLAEFRQGQISAGDVQALLGEVLKARPEARFTLLAADGQSALLPGWQACYARQDGLPDEVQSALEGGSGSSIRECSGAGATIFSAARVGPSAQDGGVLVLAVPLNSLMAPTYSVMRWMGVVALLIVAVTVFEGWLGSVYISRPLARLSAVAERLGRGDLSARATPAGPSEVIHLAKTLNGMAGNLQNSLETMRAFVANASHELRTPLTSIKLQVGALTGGAREDPRVAQRFLTQIDGEIDRLSRMVNDMLDLTQVEGGGSPLVVQPVDLLELAREVRAFWEPRSRQAGLRLQLINENRLPPVQGDSYRLRQLFDILLDNAVKHTASGGSIDMALSRPSSGNCVRIEVRDTGTGIQAQHLPRIFDRFYRVDRPADPDQVDASKRGLSQGSGIGLAIARSIAAAHGGQIGVESTPGTGSTFWVELPL